MFRSHLTQQLQNYFDINDARVRQLPWGLDGQLLNLAGQSLDLHQLRVRRETEGRFLSRCPLQIDNQGTYFQYQIPNAVTLQTDAAGNPLAPATVIGTVNGQNVTLSLLDDTLPVPSAVVDDTARTSLPLTSPKLGTIQADTPLLANIGVLPVPNTLSFWASGFAMETPVLTVLITGIAWPTSLWAGTRKKVQETLTITAEGLTHTVGFWYSVSEIRIFDLPEGVSVDVYGLELDVPFIPDPSRPFMEWEDRTTWYPRYWSITPTALKEVYYQNPAVGFSAPPPVISSLALAAPVNDIAVEPFTYGLWVLQESQQPGVAPKLHYLDRREPAPDSLAVTGLTAPPNYGLSVCLDDDASVPRQVLLDVTPYAGAGTETAHRFSVRFPDGTWYAYYFDAADQIWALQPYDASFWVSSNPFTEVAFPLTATGTYLFKLETRDGQGNVLYDVFPFLNRGLNPVRSYSLPQFAHAKGIAFDAQQQLWLWDGNFLHPLQAVYQNYLFDPSSRSLYFTQPFDSIEVYP